MDTERTERILTSLTDLEAGRLPLNEESPETAGPNHCAPTGRDRVCPKCQVVLPGDSEFCQVCGTKLPAPDPNEPSDSAVDREQQFAALQEAIRKQQLAKEMADLNRRTAQQAAYKGKLIFMIIVLSVVLAVIVFGSISSAINKAHNSKLRNFATEPMNSSYTNVYADIVSMEPEYAVYSSSSYSPSYSPFPASVICRCKTVEDETIWAEVRSSIYPGSLPSFAGLSGESESLYYSASDPERIVG